MVTFTNNETLVSDVGGAYTLRIPLIPDSREWRIHFSASPTYAPNTPSITLMLDNQLRLHGCTGHGTEDKMCSAVTTTWLNTGPRGHQEGILSTTLLRLCSSET